MSARTEDDAAPPLGSYDLWKIAIYAPFTLTFLAVTAAIFTDSLAVPIAALVSGGVFFVVALSGNGYSAWTPAGTIGSAGRNAFGYSLLCVAIWVALAAGASALSLPVFGHPDILSAESPTPQFSAAALGGVMLVMGSLMATTSSR